MEGIPKDRSTPPTHLLGLHWGSHESVHLHLLRHSFLLLSMAGHLFPEEATGPIPAVHTLHPLTVGTSTSIASLSGLPLAGELGQEGPGLGKEWKSGDLQGGIDPWKRSQVSVDCSGGREIAERGWSPVQIQVTPGLLSSRSGIRGQQDTGARVAQILIV